MIHLAQLLSFSPLLFNFSPRSQALGLGSLQHLPANGLQRGMCNPIKISNLELSFLHKRWSHIPPLHGNALCLGYARCRCCSISGIKRNSMTLPGHTANRIDAGDQGRRELLGMAVLPACLPGGEQHCVKSKLHLHNRLNLSNLKRRTGNAWRIAF